MCYLFTMTLPDGSVEKYTTQNLLDELSMKGQVAKMMVITKATRIQVSDFKKEILDCKNILDLLK